MFIPGDARFLAMFAALASLFLIAALLCKLKDLTMRNRLVLAAVLAVGVALSGCAGQTFLRPNPDLDLSIQQKQAETAQAFYARLGERLIYCDIRGSGDVALRVSPDAGAAAGLTLTCPPKPFDEGGTASSAVPLSQLTEARVAQIAAEAAMEALNAFAASLERDSPR